MQSAEEAAAGTELCAVVSLSLLATVGRVRGGSEAENQMESCFMTLHSKKYTQAMHGKSVGLTDISIW